MAAALIDTSSAMGQLVFHIFGAMAEFERGLIRERTKAGLAAAKARGRMGGRRPKLTKQMATDALKMLAEGATVREVAEKAKVSRTTVYQWMNAANKEPVT